MALAAALLAVLIVAAAALAATGALTPQGCITDVGDPAAGRPSRGLAPPVA